MASIIRLVGGGTPQEQQHDDAKLLQLADRGEDQTEQATPSSQQEREEATDDGQDDALASVITQVSVRDQQKAAPPLAAQYAPQSPDDGSDAPNNWKNKFRCAGSWQVECTRMSQGLSDSRRILLLCLKAALQTAHAGCTCLLLCAHFACRSIFCCLAPSPNEQYVRQDEGPVVIRPIAPQPPGWTEPVLGPQLPQDSGKKCLILDLGGQGQG